jgi:hypothetical protein
MGWSISSGRIGSWQQCVALRIARLQQCEIISRPCLRCHSLAYIPFPLVIGPGKGHTMTETSIEISVEQRFLQQAERCRVEATRATSEADRTTWLQMANDWTRLAKGAAPTKNSTV